MHEIDIYNEEGDGVSAQVRVLNTWELREFVSIKIAEILKMLPLPIEYVKAYLSKEGLANIADLIIEEIKLQGAYEREGFLLPP